MTNLEKSHPDIIMLSDTRLDDSSELVFRNEVDYHCHFNSFNSTSRGVCILIKKSFPLTVLNKTSDNEGNIICLTCEYDSKMLSIISVYGPNNDSPHFFEQLFDYAGNSNTEYSIIGGDYNVTLNHELDNLNYVNERNNNARRKINEIMESNDLIDAFRFLNGNLKEYTWTQWGNRKYARLDYFLTSGSLGPFLSNHFLLPAIKSDHKPVVLCIDFERFTQGKGLWTFDARLLKDPDYVKCVKKVSVSVVLDM